MNKYETPRDNHIMTRCAYLLLLSIGGCIIIPLIFLLVPKNALKQVIAPILQYRRIEAHGPAIRVRLKTDTERNSHMPYLISILDQRGNASLRFPFTNVAGSLSLEPRDEVLLDSYHVKYGFTDAKVFGVIPLGDSPNPWRGFVVSVSQNHEIVAVIPCEEIFSQAELIGRSKTITTTVRHINDSNLVTTDNPVEVRVQEIVCTILLDPASKPQETVPRGGTFHFQTPKD